MVGFTEEQSCTDGSTDAFFFPSSVHPTLYKSVGPSVITVGGRGVLTLILISGRHRPSPFVPSAAIPSASSLPRVRVHPTPLRRPSALATGRPRRPSSRNPRVHEGVTMT
jgi:hypothetical protein